jgi:hypothetical protein
MLHWALGGGKGTRPKLIEPPKKVIVVKRIDLEAYLQELRKIQKPIKEVS